MNTKLVDGLIPAYTNCPFRKDCILELGCHHMGILHKVAFSCASARGFDILNKYTPKTRIVNEPNWNKNYLIDDPEGRN